MSEAQAALSAGRYKEALSSCERALRIKTDDAAAKLCAYAACKLKDSAKAARYRKRVRSPSARSMIRQQCLSSGVQLD